MFIDLFNAPWLRNGVGRTFKFLSPNTWTTLSLVFAFAGLATVASGRVTAGLLLFLWSGCCDFIDGSVAKTTGRTSKIGAFWDGTVDRFVDAMLIGCFFFLPLPVSQRTVDLVLFSLLFATLMPPFIVAYANHRGAVPDPTERVIWRIAFRYEYLVTLIVAMLVLAVSPRAAWWMLLTTLVMMIATVVQSIVVAFLKAKTYS